MKKLFKRVMISLITVFVTLSGFYINGESAHAEGIEQLNFGAQPVGANTSKGYFDLSVEPGRSYRLPVRLTNKMNKPITVKVTPVNALSSIYGGIEYVTYQSNKFTRLLDKSRAMQQYVSGERSINLKPHEKKIVYYTVKSPKKTGIVLGGLSFMNQVSNADSGKKDSNIKFSIRNQVERVIGIQLNYPQKEKEKLTLKKPTVMITPSGPFLMMDLTNNNATISDNIRAYYQVSQNGKKLFNGSVQSFKMAPNTQINYPAAWKAKKFQAGLYQLNMKLITPNESLNRSFSFSVSDGNTVKFAQTNANVPTVSDSSWWFWWLWIIIIILFLIILLLLLFLLYKRRKDKKEKRDLKDTGVQIDVKQ